MKRTYDAEFFDGKCPYTGKPCYEWECNSCEVDAGKQDPYDFARWVATEIFDDMWEHNKDAFAEIACRKLEKLGIVRSKGDEWELVDPQKSDHKCHTCKHYTSGENDGSCGSYICKNYSGWEDKEQE